MRKLTVILLTLVLMLGVCVLVAQALPSVSHDDEVMTLPLFPDQELTTELSEDISELTGDLIDEDDIILSVPDVDVTPENHDDEVMTLPLFPDEELTTELSEEISDLTVDVTAENHDDEVETLPLFPDEELSAEAYSQAEEVSVENDEDSPTLETARTILRIALGIDEGAVDDLDMDGDGEITLTDARIALLTALGVLI